MRFLDPDSLQRQIEELDHRRDKLPQGAIDPDLRWLILDALECVSTLTNVRELEARIGALGGLETVTLRGALDKIEAIDLRDKYDLIHGHPLNPRELLESARKAVGGVSPSGRDPTRALLYLELVVDRYVSDLLLCLAEEGTDTEFLVELARSKLESFSDAQIVDVWQRVRAELDPTARSYLPVTGDILPSDFLADAPPDVLRARIADYLVRLKPALIAASLKSETPSLIPMRVLGLARLLAISTGDAAAPIAEWEIALARCIARLGWVWPQLVGKEGELQALLGLKDREGIFDDRGLLELNPAATKSLDNAAIAELALYSLRLVVGIAQAQGASDVTVEAALVDYKLGIELMLPEIRRSYVNARELSLQKELCKYLLDRGIRSVGTRFGRSETDLVADGGGAPIVLEAKVCRRRSDLSEAKIVSYLGQLASYRDQHPSAGRGVLIIYNTSETLVEAPREWIRQDRIVVLNLPSQAPSTAAQRL